MRVGQCFFFCLVKDNAVAQSNHSLAHRARTGLRLEATTTKRSHREIADRFFHGYNGIFESTTPVDFMPAGVRELCGEIRFAPVT